jgi:hypothetical protein
MLIDRARMFLLALLVGVLAGCGGGGGSPGLPGASTPLIPGPTAGSLAVLIDNLPAAINAAVRITGPNKFQLDLAGPQTLTGLMPGPYIVSASNVTVGNATYTATPPTQSVLVPAGASATARISYAIVPFTPAVTQVASGLGSPTLPGARADAKQGG